MDNETEVIRQQMEGTRTALSEKLGALEHQISDKVTQTTESVAGTVESVSQTVEGVKETVEGTVDAVKHTFDLNWHAHHHPWLLVGGAVVAGFVGTAVLMPRRSSDFRAWERQRKKEREWELREREREHKRREREEQERERRARQQSHEGHEPSGGGWLGKIGALGEVLDLKRVGIGLAMGMLREVISGAVPATLGGQLAEVVNQMTVKLGGQPFEFSRPQQQQHEEPSPAGSPSPATTAEKQGHGTGI